MDMKFKTIQMVNADNEPIIVKKDEQYIAVSIELLNKKYVVGFDIINKENVNNFNLSEHDYETIGVIECTNQEGKYIDFRNDMLSKLDENTIDSFKKLYF